MTISTAINSASINLSKINLLTIDKIQLARWARDNVVFGTITPRQINLGQALIVANLIQEAHRLGVIRGQVLRK